MSASHFWSDTLRRLVNIANIDGWYDETTMKMQTLENKKQQQMKSISKTIVKDIENINKSAETLKRTGVVWHRRILPIEF